MINLRTTPLPLILEFYRNENTAERQKRIKATKNRLSILNEAPNSYFLEYERWNNYGAEEWKDDEQTN